MASRPLDVALRFSRERAEPATPVHWWNDPAGIPGPIIHQPLAGECFAPIACSRLGPCRNHQRCGRCRNADAAAVEQGGDRG